MRAHTGFLPPVGAESDRENNALGRRIWKGDRRYTVPVVIA
jgi:hypothetical protein